MACLDLVKSLEQSCESLNMKGGVKGTVYFATLGALDTIAPFTEEMSAEQDGVVIRAINFATTGSGYTLQKFETKKEKNSVTTELEIGQNFNARNNSVVLGLYAFTQGQKDAIDNLIDVDDAVAFIVTNNGQILVIGSEEGATCSAGSATTGLLKQDDTAINVTVTANESKLPRIFKSAEGSTLAQDIAYLESLV